MKKIFLLLIIFICADVFGQPIVNRAGQANTVQDARLAAQYNFLLPRYADTTAANLNLGIDTLGAKIFCYNPMAEFLRVKNANGTKFWMQVSGSGNTPGGGANWIVSGNGQILSNSLGTGGIGSANNYTVSLITNGQIRVVLPVNGLSLLNDTTNTKVMTFNPTTKNWGYSNWLGSGGGGSITASNGLTKVGSDIRLGGTLTGATTIDGDGNDFEISGVNSMYLRNTNSFSFGSFYIESNYSEMSGQTSSNVTSFIRTYGDSIVLYPHQSNLYIDSLSTITTFPRYNVMLRDTVNGKVVSVPQGLLGGYWTASGNDIYNNNSGNVGIGTTTPVYPLDVNSKIGVGGTQMVYLPNQTNFTGSIFYGNGGTNLSHTSGSTGQYNTGVGVNALDSAQTAYFNTAFGANALKNLTTGNSNTAVGVNAMISLKSGIENTAVGLNALYTNLGDYNTGIGYNALLHNTTGQTNVAVGDNAMKDNTTGLQNTAVGYRAFQSNTVGYFNDFFGYRSGENYTGGVANVGVGNYALGKDFTGRYNTAVGFFAGYDLQVSDSTSGYNVFLGSSAGDNIVTGKFNTVLGAGTTGSAALRSSVLLGYGATTSTNNQLAISDSITSYYVPNVPYSGSSSDSALVWNTSTKQLGMRAISSGGSGLTVGTTTVGSANSRAILYSNTGILKDSSIFVFNPGGELQVGSASDAGGYRLQVTGKTYGTDTAFFTSHARIAGIDIGVYGGSMGFQNNYANTSRPDLYFRTFNGSSTNGNIYFESGAFKVQMMANDASKNQLQVVYGGNTGYFNVGSHTSIYSSSGQELQLGSNGTQNQVTIASGRVGINATSPAASAQLEVASTTKGFLPPRMTATQAEAISSPAEGLLIYSTNGTGTTITSKGWWGYDGSTWVKLN